MKSEPSVACFLWLVVGVAAYFLMPHLARGGDLTGQIRQEFVNNAHTGCLVKERAASEQANAGLSDALIVEFCRCKAETMAESISLAELRSIPADGLVPSSLAAKAQAAVDACYKALVRTYPHLFPRQ
jgi:hypothetical protein